MGGARVHRGTVLAQALGLTGSGDHALAVLVTGDQEPRLFEELAQRRDVVGEAPAREPQALRGRGVVEAHDDLGQGGVTLVHAPARKDVGAAHEVAVEVASQHQYFDTGALANPALGFIRAAIPAHALKQYFRVEYSDPGLGTDFTVTAGLAFDEQTAGNV